MIRALSMLAVVAYSSLALAQGFGSGSLSPGGGSSDTFTATAGDGEYALKANEGARICLTNDTACNASNSMYYDPANGWFQMPRMTLSIGPKLQTTGTDAALTYQANPADQAAKMAHKFVVETEMTAASDRYIAAFFSDFGSAKLTIATNGDLGTVGGLRLVTGQTLALNAGLTTTVKDSSGDLRVDLATGKSLNVYVNGSLEAVINGSNIQSVNGGLAARGTAYGHVFFSQTNYGGAKAYQMKANPTDSAGNVGFDFNAADVDDDTALTSADIASFSDDGTERARVTKTGCFQIGGTSGPKLCAGSGSPEGALAANVGSIYMRTDGSAGTSMCAKESGTGNTGWVCK